MLDKLFGIEQRYEELHRLLAESSDDYQRVNELNKERLDLEEIVEKSKKYRHAMTHLDEARSMLDTETDPDMRQLAEAEITELEAAIPGMENELKSMLVPKDPRDERSVIVEIRAGTGGDEAALFAADLYRMYSRYAEARKWNVDVLSSNEIGIGGYKEIIFAVKGQRRVLAPEIRDRACTACSVCPSPSPPGASTPPPPPWLCWPKSMKSR